MSESMTVGPEVGVSVGLELPEGGFVEVGMLVGRGEAEGEADPDGSGVAACVGRGVSGGSVWTDGAFVAWLGSNVGATGAGVTTGPGGPVDGSGSSAGGNKNSRK